jgi:predicted ATPase/DNA-binding winged helix-turn-helix (wHTH) protein
MAPAAPIEFPPFHLDIANEQLWRGPAQVHLRPKTFAALRYLVEHAEQLVTKETLFQVLWPGTYVSDSVLMVCIRELRKALDDEARAPRFIETVHGRGYRFIAAITTAPRQSLESRVQRLESKDLRAHLSEIQTLDPRRQTLDVPMVGRDTELVQLRGWLDKALNGERQIIFVTGEPGIGKTTVVEVFLQNLEPKGQSLESRVQGLESKDFRIPSQGVPTLDPRHRTLDARPWIGRGQCIEHYGAGEAYMPVLEALGRLCREPEGEQLINVLSQYAPTWLVQMPALLKAEDFERLQRKVQGATRERMLREMAEAVEAFTAARPLILCLEDLHWSDVSTLELLTVWARRHETARLLVLGTYRPVEMLGHGHPLRAVKQELQLHQQCKELRLGLLTEADVVTYLQRRFPIEATGPSSVSRLARTIHQRTEGNPLFMVNVVDYLSAQGVLGESGETRPVVQIEVPESIQQMIEKQLDHLTPEEQQVLEVASVAGAQFSAAAVAAGTKMATGDIEACCMGLVRREQFLRTTGVSEWPDGTVATRYDFLHALYQEVLYERVPVGQRISLHKWIGEREEQAYGDQARAIATELAVHFERGRNYHKAIRYLQQAGENALRRSAHQEAISLLTRGLELLTTLPDTPEHTQQELTLQLILGVPLMVTKGWSAPEVERVYARARELCEQLGETRQLFSALRGLWECYEVQGKLVAARELGEQLLGLAQNTADPALLLVAHDVLADNLCWEGQLVTAHAHAEQGTALYDRPQHHVLASLYGGYDPGVACLTYEAVSLWALGYPTHSSKKMGEAFTLARELPHHPYSLAWAQFIATLLSQYRWERQAVLEHAEAIISLSITQEFPLWAAWATVLQGWALAREGKEKEGLAHMNQGLALCRTMGAELLQSYFLALLAETYEETGQIEEGLTVLAEALATVDRTGEHFWEAELYRLYGELSLRIGETETGRIGDKKPLPGSPILRFPVSSPEGCFHKAIEVAQHQHAKSLELRATMSLARLWQRRGKKDEARQMLADIYGWFTEGFDTKDLQEAKRLLEALL